MSVSLMLVTEDGKQREIPLNRPVQVIGRQTDCQIRIPTSAVSRHHCELTVHENRVSVRDLGSSNGTYVNRKRITQQELAPGDLLSLGEMVFVVRVDGRPASIDTEDSLEDGLVKVAAGVKAPQAKAAAPKAKQAPAKKAAMDDSSVMDFDFLDEDDIDKRQPKL
jgi:pSer/pThr/pTyr-binding forkhead associated (FHA) protein